MLDLVFDTETTGKLNYSQPVGHPSQPGMVQLGAILCHDRKVVAELNVITIPLRQSKDDVTAWVRIPIPAEAFSVHGIDDAKVDAVGIPTNAALSAFMSLVEKADRVIAFNTAFDRDIVNTAMVHNYQGFPRLGPKLYCAMLSASNHLKIPGRRPGQWAWPKLQDAYKTPVDPKGFDGAHDAMADVRAAAAVVWALEDAGAEIVKI